MSTNFPKPILGRRSGGMLTEDWQSLANAYDAWNEHVAVAPIMDEDLKAYVEDVFSAYNLWDYEQDAPDFEQYQSILYNRC